MKKISVIVSVLFFIAFNAKTQSVVWPPESIKALTSEWTGERTSDGRPKVSDNLLERLKKLSMEEVWGALTAKGYENQFEIGRAHV